MAGTLHRTRVLRLVGAVLVLAGGTIHLELNLDDYGNDDILMAFALNAAASALVAAYLVAAGRRRRSAGRHRAQRRVAGRLRDEPPRRRHPRLPGGRLEPVTGGGR